MSYDSLHDPTKPENGGGQFQDWNSQWNWLERRHLPLLAGCMQPRTFQQLLDLTGIPRATGHRHLKKLCSEGLVGKSGESYSITDAGRQALMNPPQATALSAGVEQIWPFLKRMPSRLHAAMAELILLGIIARKSNLSADQNPSFCLLGKSGQLKTWLLKLHCKLLGRSPDDCLLMAPQARARSLIGRLDGQGQLAWKNPALAQPLIGLLEHAKARPEVKEDVTTLLQGTSSISLDDHSIDIQATVIVETNYLKEDATTLAEQTGFDLSQRRRLFTADFSGVELSPAIKAAALERLESLPSGASLHLPDAPTVDLPEDAKRFIRRTLGGSIKPECMDEIDVGRIETLVRAARAIYLEPVAAARVVLESVLVVFASTNFTKNDWRSVLNSTTGNNTETPPDACAPATRQSWESVREELKARGEDPAAISDKVAALLQVMRQLREQKLSDAEMFSILENIPRLLKLNLLLHRLNLDPEHAIVLCQIEQALTACECDPEEAQEAIDTYLGLSRLGLTSDAAWTFSSTIVKFLENGGDAGLAAQHLVHLAQNHQSVLRQMDHGLQALEKQTQSRSALAKKIETLITERRQLNEAIESLEDRYNSLAARNQAAEQQNAELDRVRAEREHTVNALQQRENIIRVRTFVLLALYRFLFDPKFTALPEVRKIVEDILWAIKFNSLNDKAEEIAAEIVRVGESTQTSIAAPPDEFELLETNLTEKRGEFRKVYQATETIKEELAHLARTSHLLRAFGICIAPKAGQEVLRQNLMVEIDRLNGLMLGRVKCLDPQAGVDAIVERIKLFLAGGLNSKNEQASAT